MSKRKPSAASKHRSPKIAAKAERASQVVRSPNESDAIGSTESPSKRHNDDSKQEAPLVENPVTRTATGLKEGFDVFSATVNVRAYQAKLLEMGQADVQVSFEFARRLATSKSPVEFLSVIAEFTSKRIFLFQRFSKEMVELSTKRLTA